MSVEYSLINEEATPSIYLTPEADYKMRYYIDKTDKEIGWLGYVEELGNNTYVITDVFLVKQQVHSATTEILPDGLAQMTNDLLSQGEEGIKKYNSIKMWGHSHVKMSPTPSAQDNKQMEDFASNDYYIRLIGNKEGVWNVSLWDFKNNLLWEGLTLHYYFDINIDDKALDKEIKDNVSEIKPKYNTPFQPYRGFPYQDYDYDYDWEQEYFGGYKTKEKKETQEETVEDNPVEPYYINGSPSKTDIDNIIEYYCSDDNDMYFMSVTDISGIIKAVGDDWDLLITESLAHEIQDGIREEWKKKGVDLNELQ